MLIALIEKIYWNKTYEDADDFVSETYGLGEFVNSVKANF